MGPVANQLRSVTGTDGAHPGLPGPPAIGPLPSFQKRVAQSRCPAGVKVCPMGGARQGLTLGGSQCGVRRPGWGLGRKLGGGLDQRPVGT